jgi:hypothetical protein
LWLLTYRNGASERRLTVDCFSGLQRRQNEFAVCGYLDGNGYEINPVIADHREGIGKPPISTGAKQVM